MSKQKHEAEFQAKTWAREGYNPNFNLDYRHIWHVFLLCSAQEKNRIIWSAWRQRWVDPDPLLGCRAQKLPINPGDGGQRDGPAAWEPDGDVTELPACQMLHFLLFQLKECEWASAASQKIKPPNSEKKTNQNPENRFLSDYKESFYLEHRKVHFMVLGAHARSLSKTKTPRFISILLIPNYKITVGIILQKRAQEIYLQIAEFSS